MSVNTNPDRVYVNRQYRAKLRLVDDDPASPGPATCNVGLPGMGAALVDISTGGCCLRLVRSDIMYSLDPDRHIPSIKLLHPDLESSPIGGRIAWSKEDPPYVFIGIQFTHVRPATLDSIHSYIETRRNVTAQV